MNAPSAVLRLTLAWWGRQRVWLRWAAVVAEMVALWWLSSQGIGGPRRAMLAECLHNGMHVVAYGVLGAAALLACRGAAELRRVDAVAAVAIAAGYGAVDELHQSLVPGRVSSLADFAADVAGASLGVLLVLLVQTRDRRWRRPVAIAVLAAATAVALATCTPW